MTDAELVRLHAEMRMRALEKLGTPLLDALARSPATKEPHEPPADARRNDR